MVVRLRHDMTRFWLLARRHASTVKGLTINGVYVFVPVVDSDGTRRLGRPLYLGAYVPVTLG